MTDEIVAPANAGKSDRVAKARMTPPNKTTASALAGAFVTLLVALVTALGYAELMSPAVQGATQTLITAAFVWLAAND